MAEEIAQNETSSESLNQAPSGLSNSGIIIADAEVLIPVRSGAVPAPANRNPGIDDYGSSTSLNNQRSASTSAAVTSHGGVRKLGEAAEIRRQASGGHRNDSGGRQKSTHVLTERTSKRHYNNTPAPKMQFINLSTTYKHDETTKKKVRRHVKGEFDRQKVERSARERLLQAKAKALMPRLGTVAAAAEPLNCRLGVSDMDPFRRYPIKMTAQTHRLFRNLYSDSSLIFTTLRDRGFYNGVTDPAAFTQLLAASSWEIAQDCDGDQTESMRLSVTAIQSLNKRLSGPVIDTSDEMVMSLMIFCLYEWLKFDLKAFTVHVNGLARLVMLRGGLKSLQHDLIVQGLVGRFDMMQALLWGTRPTFPQNQEAFEARTRNQCHFLTNPSTIPDTYMTAATRPCFEILEQVQILARREIGRQRVELENDAIPRSDEDMWTPFKEQLQRIEEDPTLDACQNDILSVCKIGSLLFISRVQQFLTSTIADPRCDEAYTQEIIALTSKSIPIIFIGNAIPIRHPSGPVLAWILAMSAMGSIQGEQKRWHSVIFAAYRRGLGIWEFDDMLALLRAFPWIEEVHTSRLREIWPLIGMIFAYRG